VAGFKIAKNRTSYISKQPVLSLDMELEVSMATPINKCVFCTVNYTKESFMVLRPRLEFGSCPKGIRQVTSQPIWLVTYKEMLFRMRTEFSGPSGRAVRGTHCLRPLGHWYCGLGSHPRHGCVSAFFCVVLSRVGRGLASGWSLVQGVLPSAQIYP
jgi:hypothetical protein